MTIRLPAAAPSLHAFRLDLRALAGLPRRLACRLRQRRRLAELDDRMLRDIGVSRAQAVEQAQRPWWTLLRQAGL